jgi:capping protein beta
VHNTSLHTLHVARWSRERMEQALDLLRRLPPAKVTENLTGLVDMAPHLTEELLARVDQPLQVRSRTTTKP